LSCWLKILGIKPLLISEILVKLKEFILTLWRLFVLAYITLPLSQQGIEYVLVQTHIPLLRLREDDSCRVMFLSTFIFHLRDSTSHAQTSCIK